ncbi:MAG: MCE family protein [Candidatus Omnitrophica bacterium]|nr:MCE family protein [Candidatus Omnitrophota bacterium]
MKRKILDIRKYLLEIRVGIFLVGAVLLLFLAGISIQEVSFLQGTYVLGVKFDFAEGLKPASPVRFAGVDVGEIKNVEVDTSDSKPIVYVQAKIKQGTKVPRGSRFFINSLSLFGEKYLEIIPPKTIEEYLKPGEMVEGISSVPLFTIMSSFHQTMVKVDEFVQDGQVKESFKEIVLNLKNITEHFEEIMRDIHQGEGTIGKFLYDDSLYIKTEELVDDIKAHPWKLLHKPKEIRSR